MAEADASIGRVGANRRRPFSWLPVAIWLATAVLLLGAVPLALMQSGTDGDPSAVVFIPLIVFMIGSFATVGALLALRRWRNPIGWLLAAGGALLAVAIFTQGLVARAVDSGESLPTAILILARVGSVLFQPGLIIAGLVVLVFPDGRLPRRGAAVLAIVLVGGALTTAGALLKPGPIFGQAEFDNPLARMDLISALDGFEAIGNTMLVVGFVGATVLLGMRFRRANEIQRKQLAWFAYVAVVLAVALAVASLQIAVVSDVAWVIAFCAFAALPVAIALAVTRYRLYDIDVLINRTLVYVPLLALLAGVFAGAIAFFERVFLAVTGDTSDVGIVLSTLIVAIAFEPLRRKLEVVVDRWFKPAVVNLAVVDSAGSGLAIGDPALDSYVESVVRRVLEERR